MSASALRKKSDASLVRKVPFAPLRPLLANLQEVFLDTKLAVLFPAVPLAIAAQCAHFGQEDLEAGVTGNIYESDGPMGTKEASPVLFTALQSFKEKLIELEFCGDRFLLT